MAARNSRHFFQVKRKSILYEGRTKGGGTKFCVSQIVRVRLELRSEVPVCRWREILAIGCDDVYRKIRRILKSDVTR